MVAILSRRYDTKETFGSLYVLDEARLLLNVKTMELPYLENHQNISCIPSGEYDCERIHHRTLGICFLVKNVPGRSGILFHAGNFAAEKKKLIKVLNSNDKKIDTLGCILPGLYFIDLNEDGILDVAESGKAMDLLRTILPTKFKLIIL